MANLDGFVLTHTYEVVDVPTQEQADAFLPKFETENKLDLAHPRNLGFPQDLRTIPLLNIRSISVF